MIKMPSISATGDRFFLRRLRGGAIRLLTIAAMLMGLTVVPASQSHAYTVQKFDEPVTGMFGISPTSIDISAAPGETVSREITLTNRTGQTLSVDLTTEDFEGSDDPAVPTVLLGDEDSPSGARKWLEPEVGNIVINQGENITLRVRVLVPENAEPGGHYAALLASFSSTAGPGATGVQVVSRVGCFFLISVAGAIDEQGSLNQPEVAGFSATEPLTIGLVFNNQGNVHLKPSGRLLIRNMLGMTVADIPVPEWTVLPGSSRRTEVSWDPWISFGRYTAEAQISFGGDSIPLTTSSSFWVFPWKVLVPVIIFLAGLAVLIYLWIRRRRAYYYEEYAEPSPPGAPEEVVREKAGAAPEYPKKAGAKYVALDWIFPSLEDSRMVDLNDAETRELIHSLIMDELDFSRTLIGEGRAEEARKMLKEIRAAALRSGFLSEVVFIDDLLVSL